MRSFTVVRFRRSALLLLLIPLPLLQLWLWEGGLLEEIQGFGPQLLQSGMPASLIAAHRIAGWLIPVSSGVVFGYGIARTEPDVRLAAMGLHDLRRIWLRRWRGVAFSVCLIAVGGALLLSLWSGESALRLSGATLAATLFALAVAFTVSTVTGAAPGVVALATSAVVIGACLLPAVGTPLAMSLSPGPLGWERGAPYRWAFLVHALVVIGIAGVVLSIGRYVPSDIRRLRWISIYRGHDA